MQPLRKISPSKYGRPAASPQQDGLAKIRMRVKGQLDGPVYQGQQLITPCKSCPGSQPVRISITDKNPKSADPN